MGSKTADQKYLEKVIYTKRVQIFKKIIIP